MTSEQPLAPVRPASSLSRWMPEILTGVFFIFVFIQIWNHVMWRDELRPWQMIKPCRNLVEVVHAMRFDGVPVLWNFLVFVLTRISSRPFLLQFVHLLIATGTIYLVARCAPFPKWAKVLFAFGYYPFFEYAAITRNYAIVFLLVMAATALISRPRVPLIWLGVLMFLLTQTSIWGCGLAGLMMATGIAKAYWAPREQRPPVWQIAVVAAMLAVGFGFSALAVRPGPGPSFTQNWYQATAFQRLSGAFAAVYRAWVPVPPPLTQFWNRNILDPWQLTLDVQVGWRLAVQGFIGGALLVGALLVVTRRPVALFVLLSGCLALMCFELVFRGVQRHHGHLFMLLVASWWLASTTRAWQSKNLRIERLFDRAEQARRPFMAAVLTIGVVGGVASAIGGIVVPFSATRNIAKFINANFSPETVLVGIPDYCVSPISEYSGRLIWFPQEHRFGTCNTQNPDPVVRQSKIHLNDVVDDCVMLCERTGKDVVLLQAFGIPPLITENANFSVMSPTTGEPRMLEMKLLGAFQRSVVVDEQFILIHMRLAPMPPNAVIQRAPRPNP